MRAKKGHGLDTTDLGPGWGDSSILPWILQFLLRERWHFMHRAFAVPSSCSHSVLNALCTHQCLAARMVPLKFAPSRRIAIRQVSQRQKSRMRAPAGSRYSWHYIHTSLFTSTHLYLVTMACSSRYFGFCGHLMPLSPKSVPCRSNRTLHMYCSRIHDDGIFLLWL
jgi:hypothetical protein